MEAIETINDFLVGARGEQITIVLPVPRAMDKAQALRLAAWLVAIGDPTPDHSEFAAVLSAVEST